MFLQTDLAVAIFSLTFTHIIYQQYSKYHVCKEIK